MTEKIVKPGLPISTTVTLKTKVFPRKKPQSNAIDIPTNSLKKLKEEMKLIRELQEKSLAFAQYQNKWNKEILEEKKNNEDISNLPILFDSFFAGLSSYFINKAPHTTSTRKAKAATFRTKKVTQI